MGDRCLKAVASGWVGETVLWCGLFIFPLFLRKHFIWRPGSSTSFYAMFLVRFKQLIVMLFILIVITLLKVKY